MFNLRFAIHSQNLESLKSLESFESFQSKILIGYAIDFQIEFFAFNFILVKHINFFIIFITTFHQIMSDFLEQIFWTNLQDH